MAYVCPVCTALQADGEHLANHLAFTALLHDDDHADWLDDHVGDWTQRDPQSLASVVVDHAEEVADQNGSADHAHQTPPQLEDTLRRHTGTGRTASDPETTRILAEARELTAEMYDETSSGTDESEQE